ncbi:MAG TPA: hypothetical protein VL358_14300 [Caulobacteraceae bacterium]|jgi:hypothetical protein|nr:hypothetical protein [Caulobacteraceae bacterium]
MRTVLRLIIGCGLAGALGACGHAVNLTPLDGGQPGRGGSAFTGAPLMVKLDGKVYHGRWRNGAGADALPIPVNLPADAPIQVGRFYGQRAAGGSGVAEFTAKDGSSLVCRFRYERGQFSGSGLCESNHGRTFSLLID